ncbi:MAG: hypothetical protein LBE21_01335 [Pseudomonadales bacterium]|nr:hypothetical protein [Pseudomonadales bacterium]
MSSVFTKTLGGLSPRYYLRQFAFGLMLSALLIYLLRRGPEPLSLDLSIYALIGMNTLLYPYARYVYDSIVKFILGNNVLFLNAVVMLIAKFFTMLLCWFFAIFIAPLGLVYLYLHHGRREEE